MMVDWSIQTLNEVASTQDYLKNKVEEQSEISEGLVVHALHQTKGKGRHGRTWSSADGNLYFSFFVKPNCKMTEIGQISILTSLALATALETLIAQPITLKWPNDVLIEDKKLCGILLETCTITHNIVETMVIGIGINTQNAPIDESIALTDLVDHDINNENILRLILSSWDSHYQQWKATGFTGIQKEWLSKTFQKGTPVTVKNAGTLIEGNFETIDFDGNMLLICSKSNTQKKVSAGDVFTT